MATPWDIYVDERKVKDDRALGFLIVPNSASFMRKLYRCRIQEGVFNPHEIHWTKPRGDTIFIVENWIYRLHQHRGAKFFLEDWPRTRTKEMIVLRFLDRFCVRKNLAPPYNVVVFLDFDESHAAADIQNHISTTANIARCYHLDSRNNDCLQCCDLLLNATHRLHEDPLVRARYPELSARRAAQERLTNAELKTYIAGYLAMHIDKDGTSVYDNKHK